jgi:hypothetical protein
MSLPWKFSKQFMSEIQLLVSYYIGYNGKYIEESVNTKFLGLQIDSHLSWSTHIDKLIPKLSGVCYAVTCMFHVSNIETRKSKLFCLFTL